MPTSAEKLAAALLSSLSGIAAHSSDDDQIGRGEETHAIILRHVQDAAQAWLDALEADGNMDVVTDQATDDRNITSNQGRINSSEVVRREIKTAEDDPNEEITDSVQLEIVFELAQQLLEENRNLKKIMENK